MKYQTTPMDGTGIVKQKASNTMTTKRSPGALRAAKEIFDYTYLRPMSTDSIAEIIDDETGASDLLAALKLIAEALEHGKIDKRSMPFGSRTTYLFIIKAAIAKAEPPTQEKKGD